jgi:hypothetical protein
LAYSIAFYKHGVKAAVYRRQGVALRHQRGVHPDAYFFLAGRVGTAIGYG